MLADEDDACEEGFQRCIARTPSHVPRNSSSSCRSGGRVGGTEADERVIRSWRLPRLSGPRRVRRGFPLAESGKAEEEAHGVERQEDPNDLALARLILHDSRVQHCSRNPESQSLQALSRGRKVERDSPRMMCGLLNRLMASTSASATLTASAVSHRIFLMANSRPDDKSLTR